MKCPNKNINDWKRLVDQLGEREAYKAYIEAGYEIPNPDDFIFNNIDLLNRQLTEHLAEDGSFQTESKKKVKNDDYKYSSIINKIQGVLTKQRAIFAKKPNSKKFVSDIDALLKLFGREGKELESILEFVADSNKYISELYARFNTLQEQLDRNEELTPRERNNALNLINKIKELTSSYNLLDELQLAFDSASDLAIGVDQDMLNRTIRQRNSLKRDYEETGKDLITDWLYQEAEEINTKLQNEGKSKYILTKEKIKSELEMASSDIPFFTAMFGSAISSSDPITALAAKSIKWKMTEAQTEDLDIFENLVGLYEKTDSSNNNPVDFHKQFIKEIEVESRFIDDVTGLPNSKIEKVKALITKYSTSDYEKAKSAFFNSVGKKPIDEKKAREWSKSVSKWFKENQEVKSDAYDIVRQKEKQLSPEDFDVWFKENTVTTDNTSYFNGLSKLDMIRAENPNSIASYTNDKIYLYSGELIRPSEKYINSEWNTVKDNPYYQELLSIYNNANNELPANQRLKHGMLPQVMKSNIDKSLGNRFSKAALADALNVTNHDSIYGLQTLSGEEYKQVPVKYIIKLDQNLVSEDLLQSVLKFSQMANNYKHMTEIKSNVDILMSLINDRTVVETNSKGEQVKDAVTKALRLKSASEAKKVNERLKNFIDMAFYGQEEIKSSVIIGGKDISINKVAGKLQYLTALSSMALNITSGVNNVIWGNYQTLAQSIGGKNYTKGQWSKALGQYTANIPLYMADLTKRIGKSKDNQLADIFDAIQGEFKDAYGNKVSGSAARRNFSSDSLFFINNAGEHQIQITSMIAILKNHKVKNVAGEDISLYDAYELDGHRYKLKTGVTFSERDKFNVMNEIHAINKRLHGTYNTFDKPELQRHWYGKMALMFRKHIYTGMINRYGKEKLNLELGEVEEGYYRTFMSKFSKDIKEFGLGGMLQYKNYTPEQKTAFKKTMLDITMFIGTIMLAGLIAGGDDDKDKSWLQDEMTLQLRRFNADINFYTFTSMDTWRILNNPTVTQSTLSHIQDFISQAVTGPTDVYARRTGIFDKGDSKLKAKFIKMMPIIRQINSLLSPEDQIKIYSR